MRREAFEGIEPAASKVVATIAPATPAQLEARAAYEDVWKELVATKAHVADLKNQLAAQGRAFDDLSADVRRHIKRLQSIAGRLTRRGD